MRGRVAVVVTAILGLLPAACIPQPTGPYFKPSYDGKGAQVAKRDCGGTVGPKEILELNGPVNSKFVVHLWADEPQSATAPKLTGWLSLHAKEGTRITLLADSAEVEVRGPWGTHSFVRLRNDSDKSADTAFSRIVEGRGRWGTDAAVKFTVPLDSYAPNPKEVVVHLPEMTVADRLGTVSRFAPGQITFAHRSREWYLSPFNC